MELSQVTLRFPDDKTLDTFMSWLSDGGGEQDFMDASENHDKEPINHFDYAKAFPAWGYEPETDGCPVIICRSIKEE